MSKWVKEILDKAVDKFLENIGAHVFLILSSVFYFVASKVEELQKIIRAIPVDYLITPFFFIFVGFVYLLFLNRSQKKRLAIYENKPDPRGPHDFVTLNGVWWKMYPEAEYVEDFPYCPCCEPRQKLIQTETHPTENYKCPKTETEIKLYNSFPQRKNEVLGVLCESYFGAGRFRRSFNNEYSRLKVLYPESDDIFILRKMFKTKPFNKMPRVESEEILSRFQTGHEVVNFICENFRRYRKPFERKHY